MRITTLISGGDYPSLNAAIRAIVRTDPGEYGSAVVDFEDGWTGLMEDRRVQLYDGKRTDRMLLRGGTMLNAGCVYPDILIFNPDRIKENLVDASVDALIPTDGEGMSKAGKRLSDNGVPVIGVPRTIGNDADDTDYIFGPDTVVAIVTDAADCLYITVKPHQRVVIVEIMSRRVGWAVLHASMAGGAHHIVISEKPFNVNEIVKSMERRSRTGGKYGVIAVAEGAILKLDTMGYEEGGIDQFGHQTSNGIGQVIGTGTKKCTGCDVRTTALGHIQCGGTSTAYDRVLAIRYGIHVTRTVHEGDFGKIAALHGGDIQRIDIDGVVFELEVVPEGYYHAAVALFG